MNGWIFFCRFNHVMGLVGIVMLKNTKFANKMNSEAGTLHNLLNSELLLAETIGITIRVGEARLTFTFPYKPNSIPFSAQPSSHVGNNIDSQGVSCPSAYAH